MVKVAPKIIKKTGKLTDQQQSNCSECRHGIFVGQEREWTPRGLVHKRCNSEVKDTT